MELLEWLGGKSSTRQKSLSLKKQESLYHFNEGRVLNANVSV